MVALNEAWTNFCLFNSPVWSACGWSLDRTDCPYWSCPGIWRGPTAAAPVTLQSASGVFLTCFLEPSPAAQSKLLFSGLNVCSVNSLIFKIHSRFCVHVMNNTMLKADYVQGNTFPWPENGVSLCWTCKSEEIIWLWIWLILTKQTVLDYSKRLNQGNNYTEGKIALSSKHCKWFRMSACSIWITCT